VLQVAEDHEPVRRMLAYQSFEPSKDLCSLARDAGPALPEIVLNSQVQVGYRHHLDPA